MKETNVQDICRLARYYKQVLMDDILPFWLRHGVDDEFGGVFTCLDRDGTLMDSTKSVWFQGRFAFVCSYVHNNIAPDQALLDQALRTIGFIENRCTDKDGRLFFSVTKEGAPLRKRRYVFSECFAAMAFAEYAKASGDAAYAAKALDLFLFIEKTVATPGVLRPKYYINARGHSLTMMLINVALVIKQVAEHPALDARIEKSIDEIRRYFMHPEFKALLETVAIDGSFIDTMAGRAINPGHCIETAWFILAAAENEGWRRDWVDTALTILDWSWDWGWDKDFGGIINFRDCKGFPPQDYSQDMKFWWPQCEAIIATLYAFLATGDQKYLDRHRQINEYAFRVFPDPEFGEWFGYLHRDGTVAQPAKGNLFKGPFHIPRMLALASVLCEKIHQANLG